MGRSLIRWVNLFMLDWADFCRLMGPLFELRCPSLNILHIKEKSGGQAATSDRCAGRIPVVCLVACMVWSGDLVEILHLMEQWKMRGQAGWVKSNMADKSPDSFNSRQFLEGLVFCDYWKFEISCC